MTEVYSVKKSSKGTDKPETETRVRIQDIAKRGRAWCVRRCGKYHKMKGSYILEECPGCGSSAIKWSGIRNKRQSNEVSTLRCNRQGRGRCDHADARRRIQARAENRARLEALKRNSTESFKRKSNSQPSEPPPYKAMPGVDKGTIAPKMFTLAAAALHMSRMEIKQPPTSKAEPTTVSHTPLEATAKYMPYHPAVATEPVPVSDFSPAKYTVPASHCYNPFDPMAPPNDPTIPLAIRGGVCHPAKMQSKHQLVPLLMLQRTTIPSHNPQVQQPRVFVPPQLVFSQDRQMAFQMNPQTGF